MVVSYSTALLTLAASFYSNHHSFAFTPINTQHSATTTSTTKASTTSLYISSWGTKGPPSRWGDALTAENPEKHIQAYLQEPEAVEARSNIDGTCLVSGLIRSEEGTDQFLFDLLNHEESAFEFSKIIAFVDDAKFAKKRLLSRSARYTGLLDKLAFVEAAYAGSLPSVEQLEGVKTWVAYLEKNDNSNADNMLEQVKQVAAVAKAAPTVENVALLLTGANELEASACKQALETLQGDESLTYTLVAVGRVENHPEGQSTYMFADFGTEDAEIPPQAVFSRDESLRLVSELLQLEVGANKALSFVEVYNQNRTEAKLIKGLREAGYARPQEIDHMIRKGPAAYRTAIEEWKTTNPDAAKGYTSDAWWEKEEFQQSRRKTAARMVEKAEEIKSERQKEIEAVAKEWAKREFFSQKMASMTGDLTEEDFCQANWERAMFEGELKYRQMKGETMDEETELANFKKRQDRKKEMMLKRAKEELAVVLGEELPDDPEMDKRILQGTSDDDEYKPPSKE